MYWTAIVRIRGLSKSLTTSMGNNNSDACLAKPTNKHSCTWPWQRTSCHQAVYITTALKTQIQVISNANTDALLPQATCTCLCMQNNPKKRRLHNEGSSRRTGIGHYRHGNTQLWSGSDTSYDDFTDETTKSLPLSLSVSPSLHVVCGVFLTSASYSIPLSLPKSLLSILILNWSRCCWTSSRQEVKHKGLCICVCVCVWMLVSEISLSVRALSSQHKHNLLSNFLSCLNPNSYHVWL